MSIGRTTVWAAAAAIVLGAAGSYPAAADAVRSAEEIAAALRSGARPSDLTDQEVDQLVRLHLVEQETVRMVLLPVSVTRPNGKPVLGLEAGDFSVFEDRVRQDIEFFSADLGQPVSIAFLLDVSGSMRISGKLEAAKEAIRYFVDGLRPGDRFALIAFADEQVDWVTEFTSDRSRFLQRLAVQEGFGKTALNDAVAATPRIVDETEGGRKAIVLVTDGVDNASQLSERQAIDFARTVSVPIYTIGFTSLPEALRRRDDPTLNLRVLDSFARETGGALFAVHDPDEVKEAAVAIGEELRAQYVIGYYPRGRNWDGTFRKVELRTAGSRAEVRTRAGYWATP